MNIFSKINQNLLERYPSIWNTKIVWILLVAFCVHILFFIIGFVSHMDPTSLQKYRVTNDFFESGLIMVNVVISILLLVGWLVLMFKNNSFKNFYPTSSFQLFEQFVQYFIIVFVSISFYFSYMFGFESYIKYEYPDAKIKEQIDLTNRVYPFFSHEPDQYLITNKQYPKIFRELYCETNPNKINYSQPYLTYYNSVYQFNELYSVTVTEKDSLYRFIYPEREAKNNIELAYSDEQEKKCIFYFKKNVVNVSDYVKNANLNYSNFSNVFYIFGQGDGYGTYYDSYSVTEENSFENNKNKIQNLIGFDQNKNVSELIKRNNKEEFRKLFSEFLFLADKYKIQHNLTADKWLELVYNAPTFDVKHFILNQKPSLDGSYDYPYYDEYGGVVEAVAVEVDDYTYEGNTQEDPLITARREFVRNATTKFYLQSADLKLLYQNVDEVKADDYFVSVVPIFLWISFIFGSLIFSFRVTNLRSLLFSIISAGVISLLSGILFLIVGFAIYSDVEFFILYYILILATLIILIPIIASNFGSKLFQSILINISINGFVLYVLLILGIISYHQENACRALNANRIDYIACATLLESLDPGLWSLILLVVGFLFILLYSNIIKKWKASPE